MAPSHRLGLLGLGAALFVGFIIWALTRPVEPAAPATTDQGTVAPNSSLTPPTAEVPTATSTLPATDTASATTTASNVTAAVRRVTPQELRSMVAAGTAFVVDVRMIDADQKAHIPGAMHMTPQAISLSPEPLPRDKMIVTYCT